MLNQKFGETIGGKEIPLASIGNMRPQSKLLAKQLLNAILNLLIERVETEMNTFGVLLNDLYCYLESIN